MRVQIPPDAQNGLLASVVRLVKFERMKIPETVDAVGVQPAASKLFGSFGTSVHNDSPANPHEIKVFLATGKHISLIGYSCLDTLMWQLTFFMSSI